MENAIKLMTDERVQQMQSDTILVIVISLIAGGMLLWATFMILPHFGRKITVIRKYRGSKGGDNVRNIECRYKKGDKIRTLTCESQLLYDSLKVGTTYNVTIKNDCIVKLNKVKDKRWRRKH